MDEELDEEQQVQRLRGQNRILSEVFEFRTYFSNGNQYKDAKCRFCSQIFKKAKPDRLKDHTSKCSAAPGELRAQVASQQSQPTMASADRTAIDLALVEFMACNALSLNCLASPATKRLFAVLNDRYSLPSRKSVADRILPNIAQDIRDRNIRNINETRDYSLTLEIDGWSGCNGLHYMAIIVTSRVGHSLLLDLVDTTHEAQTATNVANAVDCVLRSSSLRSLRFNAIMSDEAANYKRARTELVENNERHGATLQHRCIAHLVNLIGARMASDASTRDTFQDLNRLITTLSKNRAVVHHFRSAGSARPRVPCPTRWYSYSAAITSVLGIQQVVEDLPHEARFGYDKWSHITGNENFWSNLRALRPFFDKLSAIIGKVERANASLSEAFHYLLELGQLVFFDEINNRFTDLARKCYVHYMSDIDFPLMAAAYYFNPRFKGRFLTKEMCTEVYEFTLSVLDWQGCDHSSVPRTMNEIRQYTRLAAAAPDDVDCYQWWLDSELLQLKTVGQRFACLRASTANTERVFSSLGRILTPARNRMGLQTMKDLITVHIDTNSKAARKEQEPVDLTEDWSFEQLPVLDELDVEAPITDNYTEQYEAYMKRIDFLCGPFENALESVVEDAPRPRRSSNIGRDLLRRFS